MQPVNTYKVTPSLPEKLLLLKELANNLNWCWDHDAISLFRRVDPALWEELGHNPMLLFGEIKQERLVELEKDDGFIAQLERVYYKYQNYMVTPTWFEKNWERLKDMRIAYFSAEFGLTESIPIYSGGLGILSGDHLKSSSELGLPLAGIGLLYQVGYFRQYLNADGWQCELYPTNDFYNMPVQPVLDDSDKQIRIEVDILHRKVVAKIWKIQVGRVPLYLLDTNSRQNNEEDKSITRELYGGDLEMRMKQEILLGIGGIRALRAMGIDPDVCHMNEGHSAFLALERIRMRMVDSNMTFWEALEVVKPGNVFTTHTPVPAGIDVFPPSLIDRYFGHYYHHELKLSKAEFLDLGRRTPCDPGEPFSMAILALKLSDRANGVSKLHGKVAKEMWKDVWHGVPQEEIPIGSVTNGIHYRSWISHDMAGLFDMYLGPRWLSEPANQSIWERVDLIPAEELWRTHERRRERLVAFTRRRLVKQLKKRGALPIDLEQAEEVLNPEALTIGFARRFATYKRANLIFQDLERLHKILTNRKRPVQIIISGKAHPKDNPGREIIREIIHISRSEEFRRHVVFIENYDIVVARYMVQGSDVWLNNPRRFMEASGTSGMKATANGVLNMSILDGWWDEAFEQNDDCDIGWAIGHGEVYSDTVYQDEVESNALYDLLEKEVVPLFYSIGKDGLPREWIARMKSSMRKLCPVFNTNRMVYEYAKKYYFPAADKYNQVCKNSEEIARDLARWHAAIHDNWHKIKIENIVADYKSEIKVGDVFNISADVHLADLLPENVKVQAFHGSVDPDNQLVNALPVDMTCIARDTEKKIYTFKTSVKCERSGLLGYSLRVLPDHPHLTTNFLPGRIIWAV